jgi:hypothetical protein
MTFTNSFIKYFSWYSIIVGFIHIVGESYFMYLYGQPFIQTLIDIIAVILLFFGGYISLKDNKSLGVLCGAWGFLFCLNYRAWAWRFSAKKDGIIDDNTDIIGNILLILLLFSCISFIISILINLPKTKIKL